MLRDTLLEIERLATPELLSQELTQSQEEIDLSNAFCGLQVKRGDAANAQCG